MPKKLRPTTLPNNIACQTIYTVRTLGLSPFLRLLLSTIWSVNHYYLLGKNLSVHEEHVTPRSGGLTFAKITEDDVADLQERVQTLPAPDRREVLGRLFFYQDFGNCYIMKKGEEIVYLQWLILPSENPTIRGKYAGKFYPLAEKQVMIENAFTFPRHRGKGYLLHGTRLLLQMARDNGYSSAVCYIRKDRVPSLNEFSKMGFRIVKLLTEYKVLGCGWRAL